MKVDLHMTIKSGEELEVGDRIVNVGRIVSILPDGMFRRAVVQGSRWLGDGEHYQTSDTHFFHLTDDVVVHEN